MAKEVKRIYTPESRTGDISKDKKHETFDLQPISKKYR